MSITAIFATLLAGQGLVADRVDVAYEALAQGDAVTAAARIEDNDVLAEDDPARLINLGSAYLQQGMIDQARAMFEAAAMSPIRYSLETADGEWEDSRVLARKALAGLDRYTIDGTRMADAR